MAFAEFVSFRTHGMPDRASGFHTSLGVLIRGEVLNGVQLHFRLKQHDRSMRVRWRRMIEQEVGWEARRDGRFSRFFELSSHPDHPPDNHPHPLPDLYDVDLPSLFPSMRSQRSLTLTDQVAESNRAPSITGSSRADSDEIIQIINFSQWVEISIDGGEFVRSSITVRWSNVFYLKWNGVIWAGAPGCAISRGYRHIPNHELIVPILSLVH